ncbi:MAG: hypothetical protein HY873_12370, partial [Chloroflexi bacterium]|nr:hypothetical protein [Chloroflexota bacterium]
MTKVIGRILSLGFPLPGTQVDNYTFLSAPSFFDYDALVVDPHAASALIEGVIDGSADTRTFTGAPIRVMPTATEDAALADILRRRRAETERLLHNGGVVVVFAHPGATHRISGVGETSDYDWLPLPDGIEMTTPFLSTGEGSQGHVTDWQHPLAGFVASQLANIAYRAHFDVRRIEGSVVFASSHGGAAIGVELPLPYGRLIVLPALRTVPTGDARYTASDVLQAGIRRALGAVAQGRAPAWAELHAIPGLEERHAALQNAREAAAHAEEAAKAAETSYDALARFQRLLWQEGAVGLDAVVLEALRLIGFEIFDRHPRELELRCAEASALFEIEAGERPIDMAAHHRLRQRIEKAIERRGAAPRGVLFVNGQRLSPPEQRQHVTDAVRVASETMRYCIAPTP